jgi:hypothetical protein
VLEDLIERIKELDLDDIELDLDAPEDVVDVDDTVLEWVE